MAYSQLPAPCGITPPEPGQGLEALSGHRELSALWRLWETLRGARPMPARRDVTPEVLRPWLGNLALINVSTDPVRLQYRLVGTHIVENLKFDPTGRGFEDFVVDPANNPLTRGLYRCLLTGGPVFEVVRPRHNRYFSFDYYRLSLPLSADGQAVNMILMGEYVVSSPRSIGRPERRDDTATKIWF